MEEKDPKEKPKKTVKIVERDRSRDQLLERVTETTYKRQGQCIENKTQTVRGTIHHRSNGERWT